ncbi:hypothetical protein BGZ57DRAFT_919355 [Hyaloscypha finlandica]|nr:hypothetical protein BGZ57DRAFT_919355 [Hyaloscypha finlandica]
MVYETGFRGTPTLFCQDRDEEVLASSSATTIQKSFPALRLLREVARSIKRRPKNHLPLAKVPGVDAHHATLIWDWNWEEADGETHHDSGSLTVTEMADVISLIVPLSFASAGVAVTITLLLSMSTLVAQGAELPMQYPRVSFVALFSLATPAYAKHRARISRLQPDVASVATSMLGSFNRSILPDKMTTPTTPPTEFAEQKQIKQRLRALDHEINKKWTIAENSVAVDCKAYVAAILLVSGLLVGGGLAIGLSLGTRIHGVDPFNVTVFCWVVAGVVVLVMKSIKVENWPWKDFMYGRVVCRGVRELAANSNISQQDIIAFLLHNETFHVLHAKGPYNALFTRKSNDGFAIDVKIQLDTLLRSGFVVVKVTSYTGSVLVCLDIRRNVLAQVLQHRHWKVNDPRLICFEVPSEYNELEECNLEWSEVGWQRVVGVYNTMGMRFH